MSEQDRAAAIIELAVQLMRAGKARGWSDALRLAKEQVNTRVAHE